MIQQVVKKVTIKIFFLKHVSFSYDLYIYVVYVFLLSQD